jgi:multidrug resistance efflux pump
MKFMQRAFLWAALSPFLVLAGCGAQSGSTSTAGNQAAAPASGGQASAAARPATSAGGQGGAPGSFSQGGGRRFATISVQAITVQSAPLVTDNNTAGTVTAVTQSQVAAQVSGVVAKVLHRQGDWVTEGTPVIQLDDAALKLAVRNAQATLDNAKINLSMGQQTTAGSEPKLTAQLESAQNALNSAQKNYESQKAQYDLGGISASALDNVKSQLGQAQANVEAAKLALDQNAQAETQNIAQLKLAVDQAGNQLAIVELNLQNAAIRAPFNGQIAVVNVTPGMYLSLNSAAFLLVSTDKQINFTEPPTDAPNFKIGDPVIFTIGGKNYPVRIAQTPSAPINGVVPMTASVPASVSVSYGTVGTISYKLTIGTGPQIPLAALQSRADTNFVFTIQNGKAVEAPVIMIAEAGTTAVVQGVNPGDQVIINPPPGLLAGSAVQVVTVATAQGQGAGNQQGQGTGSQTGQRTGRTGQPGAAGSQAGSGQSMPGPAGQGAQRYNGQRIGGGQSGSAPGTAAGQSTAGGTP